MFGFSEKSVEESLAREIALIRGEEEDKIHLILARRTLDRLEATPGFTLWALAALERVGKTGMPEDIRQKIQEDDESDVVLAREIGKRR